MIGATSSKSNITLLFVVLTIGIFLSVISYQYSTFTAGEISKIASQDARNNARIKVYDLSQILVHSINSINNNLISLIHASVISNTKVGESSQALIDAAQYSTRDLTDSYFWLDYNGRLLTSSNVNGNSSKEYGGQDLSKKEYFIIPKLTHTPFYSSTVESSNKIPILYISFPIVSNDLDVNTTRQDEHTFKGVVVAQVRLDNIGKFLQKQLATNYISSVGLMDHNGIFLYARNESLVGKSYLSDEFQSTIPAEIKQPYNDILKRSLEDKAGAEDITFLGNTTTITYQPVEINGKLLWTLYIGSPHRLASDVGFLIDEQKNFSTLMVIIIGAVAFVIALLILSWNKRLEAAVGSRTKELKTANDSLLKSNELLAAANERLKVHDKMQKEFINIAAHELRTPIMPILGDAEFLEHHFNDKSKIVEVEKEQIASIIRNAKRLDRLARDILDVTKIESKSLKLNKEKFALNDVLIDVIQDARELDTDPDYKLRKKIQIHCNVDEKILVYADRVRITQVIWNLLNNAIKFTEQGYIFVSAYKYKENIVVSVKDSGLGIDPEVLPRLFTKFATKSDSGTGLGLFISRSIVEAHGGKIWAENNINEKGSIFSFTLPVY